MKNILLLVAFLTIFGCGLSKKKFGRRLIGPNHFPINGGRRLGALGNDIAAATWGRGRRLIIKDLRKNLRKKLERQINRAVGSYLKQGRRLKNFMNSSFMRHIEACKKVTDPAKRKRVGCDL